MLPCNLYYFFSVNLSGQTGQKHGLSVMGAPGKPGVPGKTGAKGILYRLLISPPSHELQYRSCRLKLKKKNQGCLLPEVTA